METAPYHLRSDEFWVSDQKLEELQFLPGPQMREWCIRLTPLEPPAHGIHAESSQDKAKCGNPDDVIQSVQF